MTAVSAHTQLAFDQADALRFFADFSDLGHSRPARSFIPEQTHRNSYDCDMDRIREPTPGRRSREPMRRVRQR